MESSRCGNKRTRLVIGLVFLTLATVLLTRGTDQMIDTSTFVDRGYQILADLDAVQFLLKEDESAQLGFLATGNQDFLTPVDQVRTRMDSVLGDLDRLIEMEIKLAEDDQKELPEKKDKLSKGLRQLVRERFSFTKAVVDVGKGRSVADVRGDSETTAEMDALIADMPAALPGLDAARKIVASGAGKEFAERVDVRIKELRQMQETPLKARLASVYDSAEDLAGFVVGIHFVYVGIVVVGLLLILAGWAFGWQWVRNVWFRSIHLTMILIVVVEAILQIRCPLTDWETDLKVAAGKQAQDGAFIARWMHQVVFRDDSNWKEHQWIFEIAYICVGVLVLLCFWLVPPCRRKKTVCAIPPDTSAPAGMHDLSASNSVKT